MKKITALFAFFALSIALFFVACQKETNQKSETIQNTSVTAADRSAPGPYIEISGEPFRGKKWSAKHGVDPCTQGKGLCDVEINIGWDFGIIKSNGGNSYDIEFLQDIGAVAGEEFYGIDEDPLTLPFEIASYFGNQTMVMIPGNYYIQIDPAHPYGFVTVNCMETPLSSPSVWRPIGPITFEHFAFIGCVPHFGFCTDPYPWPSGPLGNLGANQAAGQVTLLDGRYVFCDLDGNSLSNEFINDIVNNPNFELSNNYVLPQNMLQELAVAAGVPVPANVVFDAGNYPVDVIGNPSPAAKIKIRISYDVVEKTITIKIIFK